MMISPDPRAQKDTSPQLTRLYISALLVVALLSIVGQILVQTALEDQERDSYVVNMAGRQRMLSQRICKLSLLLERDRGQDLMALAKDLDSTHNVWKTFHYGLYHGDERINLTNNNSEKVDQLFAIVDPFFNEISQNVAEILFMLSISLEGHDISGFVTTILTYENRFLKGMDDIVKQYEREAEQKVAFLQRIELGLLIITLMVLIFEGLFIFRPASLKIKMTISILKQTNSRLQNAYHDLEQAQVQLKKVNAELEERVHHRTQEVSAKNEQLQEMNLELTKVNSDLDNFIYTASHDLKGPINNIKGLLDSLTSIVPDISGRSEGIIDMLYDSIHKFRNVIKDLSDTAKVKKEAKGELSLVSFQEVYDEIRSSMLEAIATADAKFSTDFTEVPHIRYSRKNLRSILYNLVSNAIKYRSPSRTPQIRISTRIAGQGKVVLEVQDNGLGIKEEDMNKVFSIYQRIHEHIEGTGVGMSIVKKIVENNGGKIDVESEEGIGTIFRIYFVVTI